MDETPFKFVGILFGGVTLIASMLVMQSCSTVNQNEKDGVITNRLEDCQYVMVYVKSSSDDYSIIRVLETQMKLTNDLEIFGNLNTEGYQTIMNPPTAILLQA